MTNTTREAKKGFELPLPQRARDIRALVIDRSQELGYREIGTKIERSAPWVCGFIGESSKGFELSFEGMCRFLAALDLDVTTGSEERLVMDEITASLYRNAAQQFEREASFFPSNARDDLMKRAAAFGLRKLLEMSDVARDEHGTDFNEEQAA
jgi:hypothetical protein